MLANLLFHRGIARPLKELQFNVQARKLIQEGIEELAKAVVVTLGPKGRNAMIEQAFGPPKVTKDGVTVARAIEFKDAFRNMGAQLVIGVAQKTNDVAGDGTTTATLLCRDLYAESLKALSAGMNPTELRKGIALAVDAAVGELKLLSRPVTTHDEIAQVATISANGDAAIGGMLADAFKEVGKDGVVTLQTGKTFEHKLEVVKGLRIDRGYLAPLFVTDTKTQKCEYDNSLVLVTDAKITSFKAIQPLLEAVLGAGRPLLIIAEDITGDALTALVVNKLRAGLKVVAIKAPGFGEGRKATLQDVAIATGATLVDEELGIRFESVKLSQLGSCKRVTVARDDCVMVGGAGDKAEIAKRVEVIREHIRRAESNWERERLQERLSRLISGIAMISVGGNSETESNELRDLFEDALNATRAALEEGIVPGGGVALVRAALALDKIRPENLEQRTGVDIVRRAILQPLKEIANNAGESGDVVAAKVAQSKSGTLGFDAKTMEYDDMFKRGIVDPTKVVRLALLNAASVVSSMAAAELLVVEAPEEEQPAGVPKR